MSVVHLELLVEDLSMEAALRALLPGAIGTRTFTIHSFQGKSDLLGKLPHRLCGYASWLPRDWRIFVVVDRDDDDCMALKAKLEQIAATAGLPSKTTAGATPYAVVNRLAIEELEAWFFGDWDAVRAAYRRVPRTIPAKAAFRNPDAIRGGTWEALERILRKAGYFRGGLRKIEAARTIAAYMNPDHNSSPSFRVFHQALVEATMA